MAAYRGPSSFTPHLVGRLILAKPNIDRMTQEVVGRPGQIGDLPDELWLDPMDAGKNERRSPGGISTRWP
jgi:hypothetical protein